MRRTLNRDILSAAKGYFDINMEFPVPLLTNLTKGENILKKLTPEFENIIKADSLLMDLGSNSRKFSRIVWEQYIGSDGVKSISNYQRNLLNLTSKMEEFINDEEKDQKERSVVSDIYDSINSMAKDNRFKRLFDTINEIYNKRSATSIYRG